ncbi:uncharacterized protein [Amphiura filiformis]|uniref:uncharacterized protein n=1 Tax=Amphiura filiformis TaxID=82378 RepID=UPI003B21A529
MANHGLNLMLRTIIIVTIGLFNTEQTLCCSALSRVLPAASYELQCFDRKYTPATELCCNGTVYQKRSDQDYKCCGNDIYSAETHKCCGTQRLLKDDPTLCCNGRTYTPTTHTCCSGNLMLKQPGYGCCGGNAIDLSTQTCCYTGRQWSPVSGVGKCCGPDKVYNPMTELCCVNGLQSSKHLVGSEAIEAGNMQCCGFNNTYNTVTEHCCQNTKIAKTNFSSCCGTGAFDESNQICCGGSSILPLTEGRTECCASWGSEGSTYTPYNPANENCCDGAVTPIGHGKCCNRDVPYDPNTASCCKNVLSENIPEVDDLQACCGNQSYLKTNQVCCNGMLHYWQQDMMCCGNDTYNTSTELCCGSDNTRIAKPTTTSKCCGQRSYDSATQTCCPVFKQVFNIAEGACCMLNDTHEEAYDPETQTCCQTSWNGAVHPVAHQQNKCCGSQLLTPNELCDSSNMIPVSKGDNDDNEVCWPINGRNGRPVTGNEIHVNTYNSVNKACTLDGSIIGKQPEEEFCGHSLYNTRTELCCGWQIFDKEDSYGQSRTCCEGGGEAYVPAQQSCFAGRVFNIPQAEAGACHGFAYATATHLCDINGVIRSKQEFQEKPELCGSPSTGRSSWIAYDPSVNACCNGILMVAGETCCFGQKFNTPNTALGQGKCCAGIAYDPNEHICCERKLILKSGRDMECCGPRAYDINNSNQICCGNVSLQSSPGGRSLYTCTNDIAHRADETVCENVVYGVTGGVCCGKQLLDVSTQVCCQNIIYNITDSKSDCCGNVPYNANDASKLCCDGSLHNHTPGAVCCGTSAIDSSTMQCCGNNDHRFAYSKGELFTNKWIFHCMVMSKQDLSTCKSQVDQSLDVNSFQIVKTVFSNQGTDPVCCNDGNYDSTQHTCCDGLLHKFVPNGICCGHSLIRDNTKELCCDGSVKTKTYGSDSVCCGQNIIDKRRYECCGGKLMSRNPWKQCCNSVILSSFQACDEIQQDESIQGELNITHTHLNVTTIPSPTSSDYFNITTITFNLTNPAYPTCNGVSYNPAIYGCCDGILYNISNEDCVPKSEVCGDQIYDNSSQGCCLEIVYDFQTHICCNETLHEKLTNTTRCCNTTAYDVSTDICCNNSVTDKSTYGACCGYIPYNQTTHICCNNTHIMTKTNPLQSETDICCSPNEVYDAISQACLPTLNDDNEVQTSPTNDETTWSSSTQPSIHPNNQNTKHGNTSSCPGCIKIGLNIAFISTKPPPPGVRFVGRPVVSNCSSPLERASELIDFYLLPVVRSQPTYLKDTGDTIRKIENLTLPQGIIVASLDVVLMFTSVPQDQAFRVTLETLANLDPFDNDPILPDMKYMAELLRLVLYRNF